MTDSGSTSTVRECHGCSGLGWVETSRGDVKVCPVCEGSGVSSHEASYEPVPYYSTLGLYYLGPPSTPPWVYQ